MAGAEIGPNDIIIHLVNPYKCMDCGIEFFHRNSFLQHLSEHMDKLKSQHPCYQIVCGVNLAAQQPNSITVTKDILQINENQVFELQDSSIDYTQLPPLKMLEQAGILRLPVPEKSTMITLPKVQNSNNVSTLNITLPSPHSLLQQGVSQRSIALIQGQDATSSTGSSMGNIGHGPEEKQLTEATINLNDLHDLQNTSTTSDELQALVQQALLENEGIKDDLNNASVATFSNNARVKNENDSTNQFTVIPAINITKGPESWVSVEKQQHQQTLPGVKHVMVYKEMPEPISQANDTRIECKICLNRFASKNVLMRHQVVHTGEKPHSCYKCFKQFNNISSLSKHTKIHKRSHQCPVCLKMFLRRRQMELHLGQHKKKRFIQFGHRYHEVQVATSRNDSGQIVHEFSLSFLLKKRNIGDESDKTTYHGNHKENSGAFTTTASSVDKNINNISEKIVVSHQSEAQPSGNNMYHDQSFTVSNGIVRQGHMQKANPGAYKVIYRCGHCKKYINTRPTLSRHLMLHTNERPFRCEQCGKQFRHKSDLVHHYKTHSKPVKCLTCGSAFSKELYLQNHLQRGCPFLESDNDKFIVLPNLQYQCNLCSKVLKSKANVVRHLRVHAFNNEVSDSKKVSKNTGSRNDQSKEVDINAMKITSDNPDDYIKGLDNSVGFLCSLCGEQFRFKSYIIIHVRMHLGQRPFKCKECDKGFYGRYMLRKHQQNHTRPYKCPKCGKGFNRRYLMAHHFNKSHSEEAEDRMKDMTFLPDEKLLQCDICGKTMKSYQKSLMQYHIRLHKDVRPHQCKVCDKTFISDIALKKHSLNHSKPYVCPVCKKGFSRRYLMLDHFERNCKQKMKNQELDSNSMSHDRMSHGDNFLHIDSNQVIILKAEEVEGSGQNSHSRPYQAETVTEVDEAKGTQVYKCIPCDKTFALQDALSRHIRTYTKSTPCKYCKKEFEDKHLTLAHQRSCLGSDVSIKVNILNKSSSTVQAIGEKQEKVLKTMKEMNSKIENLTTTPLLNTTNEINSRDLDQTQSDQDLDEVLSLLTSNTTSMSSGATDQINQQTESNIETITKRTISILKEDKKSSYQCPNCSKSFRTTRGLKIHAASHVRLYKCDKCGKDFTQVANFRHHLKSHCEIDDNETHDVENVCDSNKDNPTNACDPFHNEIQSCNGISEPYSTSDCNCNETSVILQHKNSANNVRKNDNSNDSAKESSKTSVDIEHVSARLMQSGTRGRPFSCKMCRKRFTEELSLHQHISHTHGDK